MKDETFLIDLLLAYFPVIGLCAFLSLLLGIVAVLKPERFRGVLRALNVAWRLRVIGMLLIVAGVEMVAAPYFIGEISSNLLPFSAGATWSPIRWGVVVRVPFLAYTLGSLTAAKGALYMCAPRFIGRIMESHIAGSSRRLRFLGVVCLCVAVLFLAVALTSEFICSQEGPELSIGF